MAYSTIPKGSLYMNTKLYTGNATDNTTISGVGFQSDWTWIKERSSDSAHTLQDSVRGATKQIFSNATDAEANAVNKLKSWNSDGFIIGTSNGVNENGQTYASWNWKAATYGATYYSKVEGGTQSNSDTASAIGITAGSNGSNTWRVAVNRDSGFSIVKYVGTGSNATVGHGLGVAPKMIIFKNLNTATDWDVYHGSLANTERLHLNTNGAKNTAAQAFNSTSPTTSLFSVGTADNTNKSNSPMIAYCFGEKQGYSKCGLYTGNGVNGDGTFIYTGFKVAWLMVKKTNSGTNWNMYDNKRSSFNPTSGLLRPDTSAAEVQADEFDFLSNGFKARNSAAAMNASGSPYIYMAFASNPFVATSGSDAIPVTAE